MPIQQQLVLGLLTVIAVVTGIYSFASGNMFQREKVLPDATKAAVLPSSAPEDINMVDIEAAASASATQIAMQNLLQQDNECDVHKDTLHVKLWTHDGGVRLDTVTEATGSAAVNSSVIFTKEEIYVWDNLKKVGLTLDDPRVLSVTPADAVTVGAAQLGLSPDQFIAKCTSQQVNVNLFKKPAHIAFTPFDPNSLTSLFSGFGGLGNLDLGEIR